MNTWMWSVKGDPHFERFSGFMGSFLGRLLIKRLNFFARIVLKQAYGDKSKLTKNIHNHYLNALKLPNDRKGCWTFPKRIIESNQWLAGLWSQRDKIANKPSLILWGKKDIAFRTKKQVTSGGHPYRCPQPMVTSSRQSAPQGAALALGFLNPLRC